MRIQNGLYEYEHYLIHKLITYVKTYVQALLEHMLRDLGKIMLRFDEFIPGFCRFDQGSGNLLIISSARGKRKADFKSTDTSAK